MSFLFTWFPSIVKSGGFASAVLTELGGEVFAFEQKFGGSVDPDGVDASFAAPTGVQDVIFGLRGSNTEAGWFGILRTKTGATVRRARVGREATTGNVIVFFEVLGADVEVIAADGSLLTTVTPQSGIVANCAAVMLSADGNSLVWGHKEYKLGLAPAPTSLTYVYSYGMGMLGNDVLLSMLIYPQQVDFLVADLDDGVTLTLPDQAFAGTRVLQMVTRINASDGVTQDAVLHAHNDLNGSTSRFNYQAFSASAAIPIHNGGSPSLNANGKYVLGVQRDAGGDHRLAYSTASPILMPSSGDDYTGVYKANIVGHLPDWLIDTKSDYSSNRSAGPLGVIDSNDNVYWRTTTGIAASIGIDSQRLSHQT